MKRGEKMALKLFHDMAEHVPAYKHFLTQHNINHRSIKTIIDFKKVPTIDKTNYLRRYPLHELCWDGVLAKRHYVISSTSGSTGEPFYFPRTKEQDEQYALMAELYLRANFDIQKHTTLYINAFPLGVWIGGLFTYAAITRVAEKGNYALSLINPGINVPSVIAAIKKFSHSYDQIIIGSYAPFLKDILDEGTIQGIPWSTLKVGFVFSAEGFSEEFREHVLTHTAMRNTLKATLNHYGTVDCGTMSYETPISIAVRKHLLSKTKLRAEMFEHPFKVPTLTQFIPEQFYFEQDANSHLLCSARSGIPLVRYDLKDYGHVYTGKELEERTGLSLVQLAKKSKIEDTRWNLPFVQVFERADLSVSYFAFQVYPDTIRRAIQRPEYRALCSGKFTMRVLYDTHHKQQLEINIELMPQVDKIHLATKNRILEAIHKQLLSESSEYQKTHGEKGKRILPTIILWPHGSGEYFQSGKKQQWVKK